MEAFEHVRTLGAVADRVQIKPFHEGAGIREGVVAGQLNTEPQGIRKEGLEFSGADIFDLLHGRESSTHSRDRDVASASWRPHRVMALKREDRSPR